MTHHSTNKWELVLEHQCLLGEGPVWDAATKTIFWVDILKGAIHRFTHVSNQHSTMLVGEAVGAIALKSSGGLIAALENGFATIDLLSKRVEHISNPEKHLSNNRFNDGKCDPAGNFWAGTMDQVHSKKGAGKLYVLHKDLSVSVKLEQVTCSNGMA